MPPLTEPVVLQPLIMPNDPGVDGLHRGRLERRSFARIKDAIDVPTLIETQINSFEWFRREGLRELFDEISPIADSNAESWSLEFVNARIGTFSVAPRPLPCPVSPRDPVPGYHGYWCIEKKKTVGSE